MQTLEFLLEQDVLFDRLLLLLIVTVMTTKKQTMHW
jgi:hypothetical protein